MTTARLAGAAILIFGLVSCGGGGGGGPAPFAGPIVGSGGGGVPYQGGDGGSGTTGADFRVLGSGNGSLIATFRQEVARDQLAWNNLWIEHYGVMPPGVGAPDVGPPFVDFQTEIVVAIFLGAQPSDGFTISVLGLTRDGEDLLLEHLVDERSTSCPGVTATPTTPFLLLAVTRVSGSVAFSRIDRISDCP